ncbi:MAG: hypothetical protein ACP5D3_08300, partial [Sulfurovum sp.]
ETEVGISLKLPFDLDQNSILKGMTQLRSNLVDIDSDIILSQTIQVKSKVTLPDDSLLRSIDPKIQWDKLSSAEIDVTVEGNESNIDVKTEAMTLQATYNIKDQTTRGSLKSQPLHATFDGDLTKEITIDASIGSLSSLTSFISSYYTFDKMPVMEGSATIHTVINKEKKIDLSLRSPLIVYNAARENAHNLSDMDIDIT